MSSAYSKDDKKKNRNIPFAASVNSEAQAKCISSKYDSPVHEKKTHQNVHHRMSQHKSKGSSTGLSPRKYSEFTTNFRSLIANDPPATPAALIKRLELSKDASLGKVRVMLRISKTLGGDSSREKKQYLKIDKTKNQVIINDAASSRNEGSESRVNISAPKMFAFDRIFDSSDGQSDVSECALSDVIQSVLNGSDGSLFCYGYANLGKSETMIGNWDERSNLGIVGHAITWLYKCIKERKARSDARFSVRVSAVEISGVPETLLDLLARYLGNGDQSPGVYLKDIASKSSLLGNVSEIRAPSAEKAAQYLDAALAGRTVTEDGRRSHFIYTLQVYQYHVNKTLPGSNCVVGGRSRLHLIDFGDCERTKTSGGAITMSGLGNVILGIFNGQKNLPFKDSPVTVILKECLGSLTCQATMLAHVSPEPCRYSETLHTIQLASRIHRMRRKRLKYSSGSGGGSGSGSSDENRKLVKLIAVQDELSKSSSEVTTSTDPSSSEQSCDTVVYCGPKDDEGTDIEHPPVHIPALNSEDNRGVMANVLKGTTEEKFKFSGSKSAKRCSEIKSTSCDNSPVPRRSNHNMPFSSHNVYNTLPKGPSGKMPLTGTVQCFRQANSSDSSYTMRRTKGHNEFQYHAHPIKNEVWIDTNPPAIEMSFQNNYANHQRYMCGFIDPQKQMMIQHWVENQYFHSQPFEMENHSTTITGCTETKYKELTQFKTCDNQESNCESNYHSFPHGIYKCEAKIQYTFTPPLQKRNFSSVPCQEKFGNECNHQHSTSQDDSLAASNQRLRNANDFVSRKECASNDLSEPLSLINHHNIFICDPNKETDDSEIADKYVAVKSEDKSTASEASDVSNKCSKRSDAGTNTDSDEAHKTNLDSSDTCDRGGLHSEGLSRLRPHSPVSSANIPKTDNDSDSEPLELFEDDDDESITIVMMDTACQCSEEDINYYLKLNTLPSNEDIKSLSMSEVSNSNCIDSDNGQEKLRPFEDYSAQLSSLEISSPKSNSNVSAEGTSELSFLQQICGETIAPFTSELMDSDKSYTDKGDIDSSESSRDFGKSNHSSENPKRDMSSGMIHVSNSDTENVLFRKQEEKMAVSDYDSGQDSGLGTLGNSPKKPSREIIDLSKMCKVKSITSDRDEKFKAKNTPPCRSKLCSNTFQLCDYDEDYIKRLDERYRHEKYRKVKKTQDLLKLELKEAKARINVDENRWNFELHVEKAMDHSHPAFIEAFEKETDILKKRVNACKSRCLITSYFESKLPKNRQIVDLNKSSKFLHHPM